MAFDYADAEGINRKMKGKYCEGCHEFFDEQKKYCPHCGSKIVEKDKSMIKEGALGQEKVEPQNNKIWETILDELILPKYSPVASVFLIPLTVGMGILEILFLWLSFLVGIPRVLEDSWICIMTFPLVFVGIAIVRRWTIYKFAGNSQMQMFGIKKDILQRAEKILLIAYAIILIIILIACCIFLLDYFGITDDAANGTWDSAALLLDNQVEMKNLMKHFNEMNKKPLIKLSIIDLYGLKNWAITFVCSSIIYQEVTVYRKAKRFEFEIRNVLIKAFHEVIKLVEK